MATNRPLVWRPASSFSETRCGRNQRHCEDKIRKVRESVGVAAWQPSAEASPGAGAFGDRSWLATERASLGHVEQTCRTRRRKLAGVRRRAARNEDGAHPPPESR
jgi:hypothetical protein